jgi:hypothetical protein
MPSSLMWPRYRPGVLHFTTGDAPVAVVRRSDHPRSLNCSPYMGGHGGFARHHGRHRPYRHFPVRLLSACSTSPPLGLAPTNFRFGTLGRRIACAPASFRRVCACTIGPSSHALAAPAALGRVARAPTLRPSFRARASPRPSLLLSTALRPSPLPSAAPLKLPRSASPELAALDRSI